MARHEEPYAYRYFNILAFYQASDPRPNNAIGKILNALIKALNRNAGMPDYLIIVPDVDILKSISHFDFGVSWIISRNLHWLSMEIRKLMEAHKEYLMSRRPGALPIGGKCPEIIWVKMLERPRFNYMGSTGQAFPLAKSLITSWKMLHLKKISKQYLVV